MKNLKNLTIILTIIFLLFSFATIWFFIFIASEQSFTLTIQSRTLFPAIYCFPVNCLIVFCLSRIKPLINWYGNRDSLWTMLQLSSIASLMFLICFC